ncbi:MAG: LytR C-terminal domain-containing protein [Gemmatimonadales bacterium]|nr:LytR C-terminal domain-containing protein [Gemmatimonadales bacterium]
MKAGWLVVAALVVGAGAGVWWWRGAGGRGPGAGSVAQPVAEPADDTTPAWEVPGARGARVEVLNASGRDGWARVATRHLRAQGWDVVAYATAPAPRDTTLVLSRTADTTAAADVRAALGAGVLRVQRDSACRCEVTVLVGKDWRGPGTAR